MQGKSVFSARRRRPSDSGNKHRIAYPTLAREVIRISDVVLEVLDARFLEKTRNKEFESLISDLGKKLVFVVNKVDSVDIDALKRTLGKHSIKPYVLVSSVSRIGKQALKERIYIEVRRSKVTHVAAHVGVIGYPNTGKSSLINYLAGTKAASTSQQAGHTRGIQKIKLAKGLFLLDTPGVIPDEEYQKPGREDVKKHTEISVRTHDVMKEPEFVVARLMQEHPALFESFYNVPAKGDAEVLLEAVGRTRHLFKKGGLVDSERVARLVLKDWQEGKITPRA
jgi:ribosome biogenesis GTPase A